MLERFSASTYDISQILQQIEVLQKTSFELTQNPLNDVQITF